MKLHEIKKVSKPGDVITTTVEPAGGIYGEIDVRVEFTYEPESYTQHEPDDASFRETHAAEISIESVVLAQEVIEYDEDEKETGKVFPKGMDIEKLPGWKEEDYELVEKEILDHLESQADNDEPDYDPDPYY